MISKEDQAFLGAQKNSEHFRVFRVLINDYKQIMISNVAFAKNSESLLISQGIIRGLMAVENTLKTGIAMGEELIHEAERKAEKAKKRF